MDPDADEGLGTLLLLAVGTTEDSPEEMDVAVDRLSMEPDLTSALAV